RFTLAATVLSGLTQALALVVLGRLLTPTDYGLVAGALVIISLVQNVLFMGIERAMILQATMSCRTSSLMGWLAIGLSLITCGVLAIVLLCAPMNSNFRAVVMSLTPMIIMWAIGLSARTRIRRAMEFGKLAIADTVAQVIGFGALSILAAFAGYGAWSLVFG